MSENKKWKSNLTSSSLPLEYEAAKILASKRFGVLSDYTYSRTDGNFSKDFSVDIEASGYTPFRKSNDVTSNVSLLVECKYRTPETKWLFFPDPNIPMFSSGTIGGTLRLVDEFSPFRLDENSTMKFDERLPFCYKGTEIRLSSGEVYDKEIKHGISQLQFALPRLFTELILNYGGTDGDSFPFFVCPILLTNADLYIAKSKITIKDIEKATVIEDIGKQYPYFVLLQEYGPDFERHCEIECAPLERINKSNYKRSKEHSFLDPINIAKGLASAETFYLKHYFTQFVVCNYTAFPNLLDTIKTIATKAISKKKKI